MDVYKILGFCNLTLNNDYSIQPCVAIPLQTVYGHMFSLIFRKEYHLIKVQINYLHSLNEGNLLVMEIDDSDSLKLKFSINAGIYFEPIKYEVDRNFEGYEKFYGYVIETINRIGKCERCDFIFFMGTVDEKIHREYCPVCEFQNSIDVTKDSYKDSKEYDECSICCMRLYPTNTLTTKCNHLFHYKCFITYSLQHSTKEIKCPNCRMLIPHPRPNLNLSNGNTNINEESYPYRFGLL